MRQVLLVFFVLIGGVCFGQDHLAPSELNADTGFYKQLYGGVRKALYEGFSVNPVARFIEIPSFRREWAFSVERNCDRYIILMNTLTENFGYEEKNKKVKVIHGEKEISKVLYDKIVLLFKVAVSQRRDPENLGLDGVTSYLSVMEGGKIVTGEVWSPKKGTKMYRLVGICRQIYELKSEVGMGKKIDRLLRDLK